MTDTHTIVITGTSRGLGLAMAEWFLARGHHVTGCSRTARAMQAQLDQYGSNCHFSVVDTRDDQQVGAWAEEVLSHQGPPDLLINNAALINRSANLWDVEPDEFSRVIDVNIKGVYHVVRHFVPAMIEQDEGIVVNFSSAWGRSVSPEVAPYCTTKWAIEGLTKALADELPTSMAAVALNPGIIHTDMLTSCFGDAAESYGTPAEWVERAGPYLLKLSHSDNGRSLSVPG